MLRSQFRSGTIHISVRWWCFKDLARLFLTDHSICRLPFFAMTNRKWLFAINENNHSNWKKHLCQVRWSGSTRCTRSQCRRWLGGHACKSLPVDWTSHPLEFIYRSKIIRELHVINTDSRHYIEQTNRYAGYDLSLIIGPYHSAYCDRPRPYRGEHQIYDWLSSDGENHLDSS